MTKKKRRKTYTPEFKREAVKLVLAGQQLSHVADDLGISASLLHGWRKAFLEDGGSVAFPGSGVPTPPRTPEEAENQRLRRELADAKQDIAILKKAALGSTNQRNTLSRVKAGE